MRIHIQNEPGDEAFAITPAIWDAACARAGAGGHAPTFAPTFADDLEAGRAALRDAEALVGPAAIRALFPAAAPRLHVVFVTAAGLDRMAPFDWLPPGALLLNNRGTHGAKAGEYCIMALLMLATGMPAFAADQRAERWDKRHGSVLAGRRVAVLGLGTLGGAAAAQAARFGMRVTGVRTRANPHPACERVAAVEDLDEVLGQSEFLVLAAPLTPATQGVLDRRRIGLLLPGAGVVNVGRGALLDQDALCDALDAGRLGGAVLDVFAPEPVPPGHRLWTTRNLTMTPHVSSDDPATYAAASLDILFANLGALAAGQTPPNLFDPARGY